MHEPQLRRQKRNAFSMLTLSSGSKVAQAFLKLQGGAAAATDVTVAEVRLQATAHQSPT
jgi:hypothetical protein